MRLKTIGAVVAVALLSVMPVLAVNPPEGTNHSVSVAAGTYPNANVHRGDTVTIGDGTWGCACGLHGTVHGNPSSIDTSVAGWRNGTITWAKNCGGSPGLASKIYNFAVVAVVSLSASPAVTPIGNSNIVYTMTTDPAGYTDMVTLTPADCNSAGVKTATAICGNSSTECPVTVVKVDAISTNSDLSATTGPIYVGANATVTFYAKPNPAGQWPAGKPAWSGASGSGAQASQTFTTPGSNYVTAECGNTVTAMVTVLKVESVSVDATDDIGPTKINYRVLPSGASIPSVTFTAPGMTETRANVSGDLCFTYNQKDIVPGNNTIRLSYLSCQTDITANKQAVPKGPAEEIVIATYPENDDPPVLVNIPITHKIIAERYWRITYSGAPVVPGSRTLHVGSTDVKVEVPGTREISWVLEKHRYHDNDGNHCEQVMSLVTGATLPLTTDYRKYYDSSDDAFFKPGNGLTGIAQLDAMAFDDNGNIVQPVNIANEDVDQSME